MRKKEGTLGVGISKRKEPWRKKLTVQKGEIRAKKLKV